MFVFFASEEKGGKSIERLAETDFDAMLPILITDFTSELSDTDDKPNSGDLSVWRSDGSILEVRNVISLRYSFYGGG